MLQVDIISVSVAVDSEKKKLLQNINFKVENGKIISILGKNGSGKSTLIKSLTSLLPGNQYETIGKVFFDNTDLLNTSDDKLREIRKHRIRYVFQDSVNSFDPLKKIKYYFDLSDVDPLKIEELLIFFLLPTYKELSNMHSYELSGGMGQRLLFILALLADPDLIILDEPTSNVDYLVTNLFLLKLREIAREKNKSALIVTQDINFALKSSDKITYLSNGTLSHFLPPDDFMKSEFEAEIENFMQSFK